MIKLKASLRVEERSGGITCAIRRFIYGHGRLFHGITESSQKRIEQLLDTNHTSIFIEQGSIALVHMFYCEVRDEHNKSA